jgi:hypothetical protein
MPKLLLAKVLASHESQDVEHLKVATGSLTGPRTDESG